MRTQQHQDVDRSGRNPEPRHDPAPPAMLNGGQVRAKGHVDEEREQGHRGGEMRGDDVPRKIALDGSLPESGLEDHESECGQRRPQDRRATTVRDQRDRCSRE